MHHASILRVTVSGDINGENFSTVPGKVARVAFVLGNGIFDPDHTPETLAANRDRIRAIADPFEPSCCADEIALIPPLFQARAPA